MKLPGENLARRALYVNEKYVLKKTLVLDGALFLYEIINRASVR